ncbi:ATP phosphoribosyltransferase, partial [Bordetella pertussis]
MNPAAAPLTLALSKGRIFEETMPLLAEAGIEVPENPESSRKLILPTSDPGLRLIIVRASDVPTYVQYGAADLGIAGKDVLIEHAAQQSGRLYQPIDLNIAKCRLCVAVRQDFDYQAAVHQGARLRVATKYVQSAREHFAAKGVHVDIIKLYGSMELAPLVGLADAIVDLVSTGGTLRANGLVDGFVLLGLEGQQLGQGGFEPGIAGVETIDQGHGVMVLQGRPPAGAGGGVQAMR